MKHSRCLEYDHEIEASRCAMANSNKPSDSQLDCGPYTAIHFIMVSYADLVRDEMKHRRGRILSGEDTERSLHDLEPFRRFSTIVLEVDEMVSGLHSRYRYEKHLPHRVTEHHEDRLTRYIDRVSRYPIRSLLDGSLALAVSFPLAAVSNAPGSCTATSTLDFLRSMAFFDSDEGASPSSQALSLNSFLTEQVLERMVSCEELYLPLLLVNDQAHPTELEVATINQQRMVCSSAARFLAVLGITDLPVYGLATFGSKGVVCQAWYEASEDVSFSWYTSTINSSKIFTRASVSTS